MACYFRAWGTDFDVDAFVKASSFGAEDIWRAGEARSSRWPRAPTHHDNSGFAVPIEKSDELEVQVNAAISFLKRRRGAIEHLVKASGIEHIVWDFGLTWDPDSAAQFAGFPPVLLALAGNLNCWIEVSHYDLG